MQTNLKWIEQLTILLRKNGVARCKYGDLEIEFKEDLPPLIHESPGVHSQEIQPSVDSGDQCKHCRCPSAHHMAEGPCLVHPDCVKYEPTE